ncbi:hypothetical protein Y032_0270g866 [Ancylostoma ceylanicum]|nr:hypothetical protein Y032_0270g866 [Ancylostoma ceylanicum]
MSLHWKGVLKHLTFMCVELDPNFSGNFTACAIVLRTNKEQYNRAAVTDKALSKRLDRISYGTLEPFTAQSIRI